MNLELRELGFLGSHFWAEFGDRWVGSCVVLETLDIGCGP